MNDVISQRKRKNGNNVGCVTDSEHQAYILTNGLMYTQIYRVSSGYTQGRQPADMEGSCKYTD